MSDIDNRTYLVGCALTGLLAHDYSTLSPELINRAILVADSVLEQMRSPKRSAEQRKLFIKGNCGLPARSTFCVTTSSSFK